MVETLSQQRRIFPAVACGVGTADDCTRLETLGELEGNAGREPGDDVDGRVELVEEDGFACCIRCCAVGLIDGDCEPVRPDPWPDPGGTAKFVVVAMTRFRGIQCRAKWSMC